MASKFPRKQPRAAFQIPPTSQHIKKQPYLWQSCFFMAEKEGFDLRCGAGHLGLKRATGTFPSALGFKSHYCIKNLPPAVRDFLWRRRRDLLFCGKATAVATVHRTVAKSRLSNPSNKSTHKKTALPVAELFFMAEKEGFEPSNTLWVLHDFQSCALGRTTRLLRVQNSIKMFSLCIIMHFHVKVKNFILHQQIIRIGLQYILDKGKKI